MGVTIKDIAKQAGVSYSTVSKALRDSPLVKSPTKNKIIKIAEELGYQPNIAARSLVQKKSYTIGVIWPSVKRMAPAVLITKVTDLLEEHSYSTLLSINKIDSAIATFNRFPIDAIVVFGDNRGTIHHSSFKTKVPILYYGIKEHTLFPTIDVNRRFAIKMATEYLQRIGHQRIAYIGDLTNEDPLQIEKKLGYLEAMNVNQTENSTNFLVPTNGLDIHDGYQAAKSLLSDTRSVTAIVSGSYDLTRGILRATTELGLKIPNDLSIISYDNITLPEEFNVQVARVGVPIPRIAQKISETLLAIIEEDEIENSIILEPELSIGDSCSSITSRT